MLSERGWSECGFEDGRQMLSFKVFEKFEILKMIISFMYSCL